MIKYSLGLTLLILLLNVPVSSAQEKEEKVKTGLAGHVYFKHLIGDWKAEGDLQAADGNIVKITEEWKGSVAEDGTFVMEGTRHINESTQDFRWTVSQANGLYEVTHLVKSDDTTTTRFEASVSDVALTMELSGFLNENGSKIVVLDSFPGEDRDTIESQVTITDEKGTTTMSGKITHKRVKG